MVARSRPSARRRAPRKTDAVERLMALREMLRACLPAEGELDVLVEGDPLIVRAAPAEFDELIVDLAAWALSCAPRRVVVAAEAEDFGTPILAEPRHLAAGAYVRIRFVHDGQDPGPRRDPPSPLIEALGGGLAVDERPGGGGRASLYLPSLGPAGGSGAAPGRGETVLVVDDEPAVLGWLVRTLERRGWRVLRALDGPEALRVIELSGEAVALVLMNLDGPRSGGAGLARRLRASRSEVALLGMAGCAHVRRDAGAAGLPFIGKPFTGGELAAIVRTAIDRAEDA